MSTRIVKLLISIRIGCFPFCVFKTGLQFKAVKSYSLVRLYISLLKTNLSQAGNFKKKAMQSKEKNRCKILKRRLFVFTIQ